MVNEENNNLPSYIFHPISEAIKDRKKHKNINIPYAILLFKLFHQGRLIDSLRDASTYEDLEEFHGNILSPYVMARMKLLKKNEVALSREYLIVRSSKYALLKDYPVITKHDNLEVIMMYIEMESKEYGVVLRYKDLPKEPIKLHKPSRKIKYVASNAQKIVQKPPKKKDVQQKKIEKEIKKVVASTVLMPSKTINGKTPQKISSSFVTIYAPVKKRKLRKMILPSEITEKEEETKVSLIRRTKLKNVGAQKVVEGDIDRRIQLIVSALIDQAEKQLVTSDAQMKKVAT